MDSNLKFRSPAVFLAIGVAATLVLAVAVVMALLQTGDAKAMSNNAALIGAVVALGGIFTAQLVGIALEDRRTQGARDLEVQRASEAALQNYLKDVGELLIGKPLRKASPDDNLSTVVRAQTLAVLEGLDPKRKRILLLFLYESGLIYKHKLVVRLAAANLTGAYLAGAMLRAVYLQGTDLRGANLSESYLSESYLSGASLRHANLDNANLSDADLENSYLRDATLRHANLDRAELRAANFSDADLEKGMLRSASLDDAVFIDANLTNAVLSNAYLAFANLSNATLKGADLSGANLSDADLSGANLSGAKGITNRELEEQTSSLEGAIMPDGSKHPKLRTS